MENPFPWADVQRILPVLFLFATATLVLITDLFLKGWRSDEPGTGAERRGKWLLYALSLAGLATTAGTVALNWGAPSAVLFRGALRVDAVSEVVSALILLGTFLTVVTTLGTLRRWRLEHGEFFALVLYAAGGMILLAESNNLMVLFVSLETFSMALYILAAYTRDERRSVEAALKYFLLGGLASCFLLLGLVFLFGAAGTIRLDEIRAALAPGGPGVDPALAFAGLALVFVGLGFKVGAFPFHAWIPDVYEGSPSIVTGFMAVTVKAAGFGILLRVALTFAADAELSAAMATLLGWIAVATLVLANLVAVVQSSVKRMLAYSAVSHTGYLLIGLIAALTPAAAGEGAGRVGGAAIFFYLLPYTVMTFGSFAALSALGRESAEEETFDSFRGLSQRQPWLAFFLMVFLVSLAGIPPTAGFWAKLYLFREAVYAGHWPLALVGIAASIVAVYYYIRLVVAMYMQVPGEPEPAPQPLNWGATLAMTLAAIAVIGLGVYPEYFLNQSAETVRTASAELLEALGQ